SDGRDTPHYAQTPLAWGGASLGCTGCHGSATAPQDGSGGTTLSGKHAAHVNNAAIFGTNNSLGCVKCHNRTVSGNSTLHGTTGTQYHVNKTRDYYGTMAGSYNSGTKVCSNVYCHSSGQATPVYRAVAAWTSATGYGCNGCHGADSAFAAAAGGAHQPH
ncbi:CxxxxCH/CxxCH domain c-type cytochrome, partial [Geobacter anodireducens]|uniref:CxxxxCH/CxxCH domain c-type cytochrome n=1 Tax=Geobacter soli TaxID=1510391 RepID=UPI001F22193A